MVPVLVADAMVRLATVAPMDRLPEFVTVTAPVKPLPVFARVAAAVPVARFVVPPMVRAVAACWVKAPELIVRMPVRAMVGKDNAFAVVKVRLTSWVGVPIEPPRVREPAPLPVVAVRLNAPVTGPRAIAAPTGFTVAFVVSRLVVPVNMVAETPNEMGPAAVRIVPDRDLAEGAVAVTPLEKVVVVVAIVSVPVLLKVVAPAMLLVAPRSDTL
jgi:hypothetical protein